MNISLKLAHTHQGERILMKKKILFQILLSLLIPAMCLAAGSVNQDIQWSSDGSKAFVTITWTGDADDGTVPETDLNSLILSGTTGFFLYMAETVPGDTAPTADYDIALSTPDGFDIMGGALGDRSASAVERVKPLSGSDIFYPLLDGRTLTLAITNNSVNSATGRRACFEKW